MNYKALTKAICVCNRNSNAIRTTMNSIKNSGIDGFSKKFEINTMTAYLNSSLNIPLNEIYDRCM